MKDFEWGKNDVNVAGNIYSTKLLALSISARQPFDVWIILKETVNKKMITAAFYKFWILKLIILRNLEQWSCRRVLNHEQAPLIKYNILWASYIQPKSYLRKRRFVFDIHLDLSTIRYRFRDLNYSAYECCKNSIFQFENPIVVRSQRGRKQNRHSLSNRRFTLLS